MIFLFTSKTYSSKGRGFEDEFFEDKDNDQTTLQHNNTRACNDTDSFSVQVKRKKYDE